jgi:hypothetical protein
VPVDELRRGQTQRAGDGQRRLGGSVAGDRGDDKPA